VKNIFSRETNLVEIDRARREGEGKAYFLPVSLTHKKRAL
jgi:hypothetical protein